MSNYLLIRPDAHKSAWKDSSNVLPADLAAAYKCYHGNLAEQKKLELKLHSIDLETKQMKRDFRQRREALERELKEKERDYWSCHRVFSAASLITESDSYRKRLYIGPQPTKAKLPRGTLERLSHLVRKLQAEDDLETLIRFQRCARFARRKESRPKSASSLALNQESEFESYEVDPFELQRLAELMDKRSGDSTSGRIKRIRSAPLRIASEKKAPRDKRMHSAFAQRYSPNAQHETCQDLSKFKESSEITLHAGGRERVPTKLAWAEEVPDVVHDVVENAVSPLDVNVIDQSHDVALVLEEKSRSNIEQSRDAETKMAPTPTEQQSSQSSEMDFSEMSRYQPAESRSEHLQSNETTPTREEVVADPGLFSGDVFIVRCVMGEETRGGEGVDQLQFEGVTYGSTPRHGSASVRKKRRPSVSDSRNAFQSQDMVRDKEIDRDTRQVSVNGRGTHDWTYTKRSTADHKAQHRKGSIALPKSSLHGLSSQRKSLTPRTHPKHSQQVSVWKRAKDAVLARKQMDGSTTKGRPHKVLPDDETKRQGEERQSKALKKRKVSIFKRKFLPDVLFSEQVEVESQLRNRVQGFLGTIEDGETGKEELE